MSPDDQAPRAVDFNSDIKVLVYRSNDGIRWQVRSAARGRRVLSVSSESYTDKAAAFRSLLLTTGGTYETLYRNVHKERGVYEQGVVTRAKLNESAEPERIFVEYRSKVDRDELESGTL